MIALKRRWRLMVRKFCITKPESLWKRYCIGFLFIFATLFVSHWASLETIKAAEDDAHILSVTSRQRMLSQRILFLIKEVEHGHDKTDIHQLEAALDLFEESHDWLITRSNMSPELRAHYFEATPISLDAFVQRFIIMASIASTSTRGTEELVHETLIKWGKQDFIGALAIADTLFRRETEKRIAHLQYIQKTTFTAALLVLLIEALAIFLPAQISVNIAIRRLERRKHQLHSSFRAIKQRNQDLVAARKTLTFAANHDALTGLANRRAVNDQLARMASENSQSDVTICVLKVDLDYFKAVNDTLGHAVGDQLLAHVADVLTKTAKGEHFVGRLGGDEFIVLVNSPKSVEDVEGLARAIIEQTSQPILIDEHTCKIGASVGYTFATSKNATADQLLIESDLALYEAKRKGRNQVCGFSDDLKAELDTRRTLFEEINLALENDEFVAYLQPQVNTMSGQLSGCEVLVRWHHPARGVVPPGLFLAAAEEAGLLARIDAIMLEKGLDLLEKFRAEGKKIPKISVNASPASLRDPHLPDRLLHAVRERHLSQADLTVEVLETTLIETDNDTEAKTIKRIRETGFAVVLDDFGTGYASMSMLSNLHLTGIKLDRSLITPVLEPRAHSIVAALVTLSRNLRMSVVAEGVETMEQYDAVRDLGCDVVQGYLLGHPMNETDFRTWYGESITDGRARIAM